MKYIEVEQQTQFLCIKEHDSMSPTQISGQNGNKCFCLFYDPKKKKEIVLIACLAKYVFPHL